MKVEYDPEGFASIDRGEELRRISLYAFQASYFINSVKFWGKYRRLTKEYYF